MPVRTPALFQIEESLPSIRGRRSPNLKAAGYERAKIVICKIPSFGEHRGDLRSISGSDSPDFSNLLIDQVAYVLGREPDDFDEWGRQTEATLAAIVGIEPRDEIEGMLVAQLIASHNAAMECHRRAMLRNQTFDGRHENLKQATSNRS